MKTALIAMIFFLTACTIEGPQGPSGPTGATGPQGDAGVQGPTGPQGLGYDASINEDAFAPCGNYTAGCPAGTTCQAECGGGGGQISCFGSDYPQGCKPGTTCVFVFCSVKGPVSSTNNAQCLAVGSGNDVGCPGNDVCYGDAPCGDFAQYSGCYDPSDTCQINSCTGETDMVPPGATTCPSGYTCTPGAGSISDNFPFATAFPTGAACCDGNIATSPTANCYAGFGVSSW